MGISFLTTPVSNLMKKAWYLILLLQWKFWSLRLIASFWPVSWIIIPAVPGIYRQRHPERTVFYRVLFHYFDRFLLEYENRFEREYGHFCPVIKEVVEKYLDCGNPKNGFARIKCKDCGLETYRFPWTNPIPQAVFLWANPGAGHLSIRKAQHRFRAYGLSGVYSQSDLPYSR